MTDEIEIERELGTEQEEEAVEVVERELGTEAPDHEVRGDGSIAYFDREHATQTLPRERGTTTKGHQA